MCCENVLLSIAKWIVSILSLQSCLLPNCHSEQQQRAEIQPAPSSLQPSSEEQLLLLGQEIASRPAGGGGGSRGRSVSFSLPFSAASPLPASPPRWQEHASEAGSPTLVQVLLMSRHSPGTPSPADAGYGRFNYERTARSSFLRQ